MARPQRPEQRHRAGQYRPSALRPGRLPPVEGARCAHEDGGDRGPPERGGGCIRVATVREGAIEENKIGRADCGPAAYR
jgi:hypothetical protein